MVKKDVCLILVAIVAIGFLLLVPLQQGDQRLSAASTPPNSSSADSLSREALLSRFAQPPNEYGPIDCWWWEAARVKKDKIRWQLEELKDKGVAGTWYYPRWLYQEPLRSDPPYWSEEWWSLMRFAMEEHRRLGLVHWFSDWTSHQFHQNRVRQERAKTPEFTGRRLAIHQQVSREAGSVRTAIPAGEQVLDAAAYRVVENRLDYDSRRPLSHKIRDRQLVWEAPEPGWILTVITSQPYDLDYLNRRVVDRWNEVFLGEYADRFTEFVGNALAAYGPDELWLILGNALYSKALIERVRSSRGYDLSSYLIALFHDIGPKTDQIRCDYYGTMSELLERNFYQPTSQWLETRGLQYTTIATWGRLDPLEHTYHYGDYFRYLRWFHVTGNEDPYRTPVGERRLFDSKISSSIAHLYGRQRVAMCVFWRSGWGATQEENLAWTNENYAYGINLYNRHGGLYTLMGGWYEWVPPAVNYFQPYWKYWKSFTDYVKRLSYILSQGKHRADVALLYPLTTMHANWVAGRLSGPLTHDDLWPAFEPAANQSAQSLMKLAKTIYHHGIDLDFINDESIEQAEVQGNTLKVAGLEFRAIVLPPLTTIRTATLQKVKTFYDSGGTVVAFGRLPDASAENGRGDPQVRSMVQHVFGIEAGRQVAEVTQNRSPTGGLAFFVPKGEEQVPDAISRAITRDVVASEKEVFHTHQKVGDLDVYFLFNAKAERRKLSFRFRLSGEPEIWDAFTGTVRPVHRFKSEAGTTQVELVMDPYAGLVLVFTPPASRPAVVADNLSRLFQVEPGDGQVRIGGFYEQGGSKEARVAYRGKQYLARREVAAPPQAISLQGPYSFELEPTMDNRWGDFRYPASERMIGAEARRFRYREEDGPTGVELGWHKKGFDDSRWPQVSYSYGPYWWHIGPFQERANGSEAHLSRVERLRLGEIDLDKPWPRGEMGKSSLRWQPYPFSQKFGYQGDVHHADSGLAGVSENFLVFAASHDISKPTHFLFTHVYAPEEAVVTLHVGGKTEKSEYRSSPGFDLPRRQQAWVNGEEVLSITQGQNIWNVADLYKKGFQFELGQGSTAVEAGSEVFQAKVRLKQGWNSVLLKIVLPQGKPVATYAAFWPLETPAAADPYVPRLRWFREPHPFVYDITPHKQSRVGWYRFKAPPGLQALRFKAKGRRVEAWIDGTAVPVGEGTIQLRAPMTQSSQVALRLEQEPGAYAGAAFPDPISFVCRQGEISLGDWSRSGLDTYSGVGVYSKTVTLEKVHLKGQVLLELGEARTVAEVFVNGRDGGIRMARPFRFDISHLVQEGENLIQIKVANTLANHMSSYPTKWVLEGQTVSGLLGPVRLRFLSKVELTALPQAGNR